MYNTSHSVSALNRNIKKPYVLAVAFIFQRSESRLHKGINMTNLVTLQYNEIPVIFQSDDAYINATQIAKAFGKLPNEWLRLVSTKEYILELQNALRANPVNQISELYFTKTGNSLDGGGTWLHPKLAVTFARWLDVKFSIWCDMQIESLLKGESVIIKKSDLSVIVNETEAAIKLANLFGLSGNQALLSADKAITRRLGESPMAIMDIKMLTCDVPKQTFTVTQLGEPLGIKARAFNLLLQTHGFQESVLGKWEATEKGTPYSEMVDVDKANGGTPVKQLRWYQDVVDAIPNLK
jgi:hypothetical protein